MKFNSQLPPVLLPSSSGEPAAKDAEHAGNKRAAEASPSTDLQPENKKLRRSFSFPSPLQKRFIEEKNSGAVAHFSAATPMHRPTFIPFNPVSATAMAEQKVTGSIKRHLSNIDKEVLATSEFDAIVQHYVKQGRDELEQKFDHALQNPIPGQSSDRLQSAREQAKERINQSAQEASRSEGWALPVPEASNVAWEASPIVIKRGLSLQQLKLNKADIASGGFGSVSIFENENGDKLIGKISYNKMQDGRGGIEDDLADELKGFQTIYDDVEKAGPHRSLVNVYGIATVPKNGELKRTLLMDFIPGLTGRKTFDALRKCWDAGKISSEQYWGAVQFIGRRLLDVTGHISKAGLVHNDINPDNFLVNEETGEPVVIDLGCFSGKDEVRVGHTERYAAPEVKYYEGVDERSDVFTVGASILDGVEGGKVKKPNEGLLPGTHSAETAYTKFMSELLKQNKDDRVNSEKAQELEFLNHMMLDDDVAKEVIKKAISLAKEEEQKPKKEQWKREKRQPFPRKNRLIEAARNNPDLAGAASLPNARKNDVSNRRNRRLAKLLDKKPKITLDKNSLGSIVKEFAMQLITNAPWFDDAKRILETMPKTIKGGVDTNGVRLLQDGNNNIDPDYEHAVISARQSLASYVEIENLRRYVIDAVEFLRDAGILKEPRDPEIHQRIEQVRERAVVARRIVEILDTDLSKPEKGHVRKHASELESLPLSGRSKKDNFQERSLELESLLEQIKWPNNPPASE